MNTKIYFIRTRTFIRIKWVNKLMEEKKSEAKNKRKSKQFEKSRMVPTASAAHETIDEDQAEYEDESEEEL